MLFFLIKINSIKRSIKQKRKIVVIDSFNQFTLRAVSIFLFPYRNIQSITKKCNEVKRNERQSFGVSRSFLLTQGV